MKASENGIDYSLDCGEVSTRAEVLGSSQILRHGVFSGLGQGITWTDTTYTGKYAEINVKFFVDGTEKSTMKVRSDKSAYTVQLN